MLYYQSLLMCMNKEFMKSVSSYKYNYQTVCFPFYVSTYRK